MSVSDERTYTLVTRLAAGGMGEVYLAIRHGANGFQRRVAVKLLLPHVGEDSQGMAMFLDEARLASKLDHPHIVPVIDFGQLGDRHFMAMPLVEGASLQQLIRALKKSGQQLSLPLFRLVASGLCNGLAYAHRAKDERGLPMHLVHRDMSPSNVLLSTTGGVFVTDFGIAKAAVNEHATRTGQIRGKFSYMPPEQMLGLPVDPRADLYSLGITLYELLTCTNPFKRETDPATIEAVRTDELASPRALRPDCTEGIERALLKACARAPEDRFETMEQLRDALIDGPVAQPHELGDLVSRLCPEALARFNQTPLGPAEGEHRGQTISVLSVRTEPSSRAPEAPLRWLPLVGVVLVFGALGAGAATWWFTQRTPQPALVQVVDAGVATVAAAPLDAGSTPADAGTQALADAEPESPDAGAQRPAAHARVPHRGQAYLSIDASPWARVFIDGKLLGLTPLAGAPLTSGSHELSVLFLDKGPALKRRLQLAPGETVTVLANGARRSLQLKRSRQ